MVNSENTPYTRGSVGGSSERQMQPIHYINPIMPVKIQHPAPPACAEGGKCLHSSRQQKTLSRSIPTLDPHQKSGADGTVDDVEQGRFGTDPAAGEETAEKGLSDIINKGRASS